MGGKLSQMPQQPNIYPLFSSCKAKEPSEYDYIYRLIIVGDTCTGKTCFFWRFSGIDTFHALLPLTMGVDFNICCLTLDDIRMKLQIWDTSGHERFSSIRTPYYHGTQGVIVLYDTTSMETFENIQYWMSEIKRYGHPEAVVMLVGNKCDLTEKKNVDYSTARNFADEHNLSFFEISAKDGTNTELVLMSLVAQIRQKHCELEPNC